jgi:hypothetical protein
VATAESENPPTTKELSIAKTGIPKSTDCRRGLRDDWVDDSFVFKTLDLLAGRNADSLKSPPGMGKPRKSGLPNTRNSI